MNPLAKQFTLGSLFKFCLQNTIMMMFLSLYSIVDGIFITKFAGTMAISAVNMSYPVFCIILAVGIMFGTGGSAILAKKMGERKGHEAKQDFTVFVLIAVIIGVIIAVACTIFIDELLLLLGTTDNQFTLCKEYSAILFLFTPAVLLMALFQSFFATAGKPKIGLIVTVISGVTNIVLDYIFMVPFNMGVKGAAYGTAIGYCIPAVFGLIYFAVKRSGSLCFVKPKFRGSVVLFSCLNGSSEMVTNIAAAVTTFLFNMQFLKFYGEDGVAAISIVLYFQFVFTAFFFGYSTGAAPIFSYKYGANDTLQIRKIFKYSMTLICISSVAMFVFSLFLIPPILSLFVSTDSNTFDIVKEGYIIFAVGFLFCGISIFASSLFTAFTNGKISAFISFVRTFLCLGVFIVVLPIFFGGIGIWMAVPVAEFAGLLVALVFIIKKRKAYKYF